MKPTNPHTKLTNLNTESSITESTSAESAPTESTPGDMATPSDPVSQPSPHAVGMDGRRFGTLLLAVGIVGLVATAVVVTLGLRLVDRTGTTIADSLELTAEAVTAFEETVAVAAESIDVAGSGLATVTAAVADTEDSLRNAGALLDETAAAIREDVPDSIDAIRATMPALIQSAEVLETALGALAVLGVDFAPASPPAESLRRVEAGLSDVAARLRSGSSQLAIVGGDFLDLSGDAATLAVELDRLAANLEGADRLLEGYADTTRRTAALVAQTSSQLDSQRVEGRFLVLLFGLIVGLSHFVPLAIGWRARAVAPTGHGGRSMDASRFDPAAIG